jgi:hypothetical protein
VGGDGEVEGYGLSELDSRGGAGGDLILIGAGWGGADVGVTSAAAAGGAEDDEGEEESEEDCSGEVNFAGLLFAEGVPEEEEGCGEEAENGLVEAGVCVVGGWVGVDGGDGVDGGYGVLGLR